MISADQMESAGINPVRRAETLSLDEFALLANLADENTKMMN
jgi:16S rRNA A1518/A1519 N6-dimethyltransferase RsmA/KsgA/DIM1 with predicted DNA glycosylase/AP lyase activity